MHSWRRVLRDSHIAAVAIAVLLVWSLDLAGTAIWRSISYLGHQLFLRVPIFDIPLFFGPAGNYSQTIYLLSFSALFLVEAWILSLLVYGFGPFSVLASYQNKLGRSECLPR